MRASYLLGRALLFVGLPLIVRVAPGCAESESDPDGDAGSSDGGNAGANDSGSSSGGTHAGATAVGGRSGASGKGGTASAGRAGNAGAGRAGKGGGGAIGGSDSSGGAPPEGGTTGEEAGTPGSAGASDGCAADHFGPACEPCTCEHGVCDDGISGTGLCTCEPGWLGDACDRYPLSCKALSAAFPNADSGSYLIDPDGAGNLEPFDAYCDMSFDGGGFTLIMATNLLGPDDQTEGLVMPGSGKHMPAARVQALAATAVSSQIHIRARDQAETASITSTENSLPIQNLRDLHVLNDNSGIYSASDAVTDWTGPYATAPHLWHSCGPAPYEGVAGYPNIWWSCNNGGGLHIASTMSGWTSEPTEALDMEVYLR